MAECKGKNLQIEMKSSVWNSDYALMGKNWERKICYSTIWLGPKKVCWPFPNTKIGQIGPRKTQTNPKVRPQLELSIEENLWY